MSLTVPTPAFSPDFDARPLMIPPRFQPALLPPGAPAPPPSLSSTSASDILFNSLEEKNQRASSPESLSNAIIIGKRIDPFQVTQHHLPQIRVDSPRPFDQYFGPASPLASSWEINQDPSPRAVPRVTIPAYHGGCPQVDYPGHAMIVNIRPRLEQAPGDALLFPQGGIISLTYFVHANASPSAECQALGNPGNRDPDSLWRFHHLARLVDQRASHTSWMHGNFFLNNGHQEGPKLVQGVWIVRGIAAPVWVGEIVEGVDKTGFRFYAEVEEYVGRDDDMALFVGRLKNHRIPNGIVFIAVHVNWTMLKRHRLPCDSSNLALDLEWAFDPSRSIQAPPSSVGERVRGISKENEDFILRYLTAPGENAVFGCGLGEQRRGEPKSRSPSPARSPLTTSP